MLSKPKNWSSLQKKIRAWIRKEKVLDVILFGSTARGKTKPGDLDLCILLSEEQEKRVLDHIHSLSSWLHGDEEKVQINALTSRAFILGEDSLASTLLQEGISIRTGKNLADHFGLSSHTLFFYSLKGFPPSQRVRFHYLLRGRGERVGILRKFEAKLLNDGLLLVPVHYESALEEILRLWKVQFRSRRVLLPLLTKD